MCLSLRINKFALTLSILCINDLNPLLKHLAHVNINYFPKKEYLTRRNDHFE